MSEISRFYGIVIQMYYGDHLPPHFHVTYAGQTAKFDIETLALIEGSVPARARGLVIEWAALHQDELREAFRMAAAMEKPAKIDPLPDYSRNPVAAPLRRSVTRRRSAVATPAESC